MTYDPLALPPWDSRTGRLSERPAVPWSRRAAFFAWDVGTIYTCKSDMTWGTIGAAYTDCVFIAKHGSDANDGFSPDRPLLTIGAALTVADSLVTGSNRVLITILDAGSYTKTGATTLNDDTHLFAPQATLTGRLALRDECRVTLYKLIGDGGSQPLILKQSSTVNAHVRINEIDGRTQTGQPCISNEGGGGVLIVVADRVWVGEDGIGVGDSSTSFGHIHVEAEDLYLGGDNAVGIQGNNSSSSIVCRIGHILPTGGATSTVGVQATNAASKIRVMATEIIADTAVDVQVAADVSIHATAVTGTINNTGGTLVGLIGTTLYGIASGLPSGSGNQIVATPANGSSGTAALRSMVGADIAASPANEQIPGINSSGNLQWLPRQKVHLLDYTGIGITQFPIPFSTWAGRGFRKIFIDVYSARDTSSTVGTGGGFLRGTPTPTPAGYGNPFLQNYDASPYGLFSTAGAGARMLGMVVNPNNASFSQSSGQMLFTNPYRTGAYKRLRCWSEFTIASSGGGATASIESASLSFDGSTEAALTNLIFDLATGATFNIELSVWGVY